MIDENEKALREKLRKIERLFAGSNNLGEKTAADEARKRIQEKLKQFAAIEKPVEFKLCLQDQWSRRLFQAFCLRYNIVPYRYSRQRNTTIMIKVPESFLDKVLIPEFNEINKELGIYLKQITEKIIKEEIFQDMNEINILEEDSVLHKT